MATRPLDESRMRFSVRRLLGISLALLVAVAVYHAPAEALSVPVLTVEGGAPY